MDKLTYEQRVNDAAKFYCDSYNSYTDFPSEGLEVKDFQFEGRREVTQQAKAIREALLKFFYRNEERIDQYLIENGYLPAPEVKDNIANFLDGKDINSPENEQK